MTYKGIYWVILTVKVKGIWIQQLFYQQIFTPLQVFLNHIDIYVHTPISLNSNTGMRFLMLHDVKNEDGIKNFFTEVYETYIKVRELRLEKVFG